MTERNNNLNQKTKTKRIVKTKEDKINDKTTKPVEQSSQKSETLKSKDKVNDKKQEVDKSSKDGVDGASSDKRGGQVKTEEKKEKPEPKKEEKKKKPEKPKKTEAVINAKDLRVSTKHCVAICKFVKRKTIEKALSDLEQVLVKKKAVPMKGEIPHRKGKRMMSGRYPEKAVRGFIKLLKSLGANASANLLDEPIISEASANLASRPYGRFGRTRKKRSHVTIKVREKKLLKKIKKGGKKENIKKKRKKK